MEVHIFSTVHSPNAHDSGVNGRAAPRSDPRHPQAAAVRAQRSPLIVLPSSRVPFNPACAPCAARTASRFPSAEPVTPPVARIDPVSELPAARRYQRPSADFHNTPASTWGSFVPHAVTPSALAATAPYRPPGVWN